MSRLPYQRRYHPSRQIGWHAHRISGEKCPQAMMMAAGRLPMLMSTLGYHPSSSSNILDALDETLFSGSPLNVEPFPGQLSGRGNTTRRRCVKQRLTPIGSQEHHA